MAVFGRMPRLSPASWITLQMVFGQVFGLLLFAVQAPLLGPRAFGLITIVMVFVGFCEFVLSDATTDALLSVRDIEPRHYSTTTSVNTLISATLGIAVYFGAATIAGWFGDPELIPILRWMSLLPLISGLSAAPNAATRRELRFKPLAVRGMVGVAVGGFVGLALTLLGYGVWALVWQALIQRLVAAAALWFAVPLPFQLGFSSRHCRELFRYAMPVAVSRTMDWSSGQIPRFLLGLYLGANELGLFSLASRLNDILLGVTLSPRYAVARVELRRFAIDRSGLDDAMRRLLVTSSLVTFPLAIGGAAVCSTLFHAWLNPRWFDGVPAAQFMMLMVLPMVTFYAIGALLLGLNRQSAQALISTVQTVTTVIAVWLFAPFGLVPASAAIAARPLAMLPLPLILGRRYGGLSWQRLLGCQAPVLAAAATMGAVVLLLQALLTPVLASIPRLLLLTVTGALVYAGLIRLLLPEFALPVIDRLRRRLQPLRSAD